MRQLRKKIMLVNFVILVVLWCCSFVVADAKVYSINKRLDISYLPKDDRPNIAEKNELKECSSKLYYYGIGVPVDYVKARKCAFLENDGGYGDVFAGARILAMIYANDLGVKRNLDYSLKLINQVGKAENNEDGLDQKALIAHLQKLKINSDSKLFDLCDYAMTTFMMNFCSGKEYDISKAKQETEIKLLTVKWTSQQQIALTKLRKAASAFFNKRVEDEVDTSGTIRAMLQIGEKGRLEADFMLALKNFEAGKLPSYSAKEFEKSNVELNLTYATVLKESEKEDFGSVIKSGIINTEKTWIQYRDAWVELGSVRYPQVSADSWKTWITKERVKQLKDNTPVTIGESS